FLLTLAAGGQEVELVDYVECRALVPDEAVLIITLVTEPSMFESELASAQAVMNTIVLSAELPLDPLAAYGGWIAAAQDQPSIAGPLSGALEFGPGTLAVERAGVDAPDVYARAELANPEPTLDLWDVGLGFRDSGGEEQLRLVVDSEGNWFFKDGLGELIASGTVVDVDTSAGGANTIEIVAAGGTGYFAFNERLVTQLDLTARPEGGDVFVGAGFFAEDAAAVGSIDYSGFEVWSLAGIDPRAVLAPRAAIDASAFTGIVDTITAGSPLAGPESGDLIQAVGSATVVPAGVSVEDFVARVTFVNPSDASDRPWDFGIAFREQANGDHWRVTVAADGSWEYQIGLQADLAGGSVSSLRTGAEESNTLEIAVAGDTAGCAVNGTFVSELDTSAIVGASDVWIGAGFHQANAIAGEITRFEDFAVWPFDAAQISVALATPAAATPVAGATPVAPAAATPVAGAGAIGQELALRLDEQADSGIDALAVLTEYAGETTVSVVARDAVGGEVVVIHEGSCGDDLTLPAFLLEDLDAAGRSETTISAPLSALADGAHAIAIHRSAEAYGDVVACGGIPGEG
ncbi:MAG: hypothetical protein ACRDJC_15905, partial [Thermomicrobiales bacterium]